MSEQCGADTGDGPCELSAGWGTDHVGEGRCRYHGGASTGAPENNGNAETHGLTSDPGKYYERQSEAAQERIDEWAESWARRADYGLPGFDKVLHTTAVTLHQVQTADAYIADEGVVVETIVDRTEGGAPIKQDEENPANLLKSRAMKDVIRTLKEFGCLDDPDSQQADAIGGLSDGATLVFDDGDGAES